MATFATTRRFAGRSTTNFQAGSVLRMEQLERRDLMAGNVTATVSGGNLVITGDSASNSVAVSRVDATTYKVWGKTWGGQDTWLRGVANGAVTLSGVTGDITVNMNAGNDEISFHGTNASYPLVAPRDLKVYTQDGNDTVSMFNVRAGRDMYVNTGAGVDSFIAETLTTGNNLFVLEDDSPYAVNANTVNIYRGSRIGGQLQVRLSAGHDSFRTDGTTAQSLWMTGGAGNDGITVSNTKTTSFVQIDPARDRTRPWSNTRRSAVI